MDIQQPFWTRTDISALLSKYLRMFILFAGRDQPKKKVQNEMLDFAAYNFKRFDVRTSTFQTPCEGIQGHLMHNSELILHLASAIYNPLVLIHMGCKLLIVILYTLYIYIYICRLALAPSHFLPKIMFANQLFHKYIGPECQHSFVYAFKKQWVTVRGLRNPTTFLMSGEAASAFDSAQVCTNSCLRLGLSLQKGSGPKHVFFHFL